MFQMEKRRGTWLALLVVLLLADALTVPVARAQTAEDLQVFLETTEEILQQAAEVVLSTESPRARRILKEAHRLHLRSIELAADGFPGKAFLLSRRAREGARLALRLARESQGLEDRIRLRLERYRDFRELIIDRVREAGNETAWRFVRESERQALRAREHYQQGDFEMALQLIEPAEKLMARAARLIFEGGGAQGLEQELESTRNFLESVAERLDQGDAGEDSRGLLASAREALNRAEGQKDQGHPLRCLRSLQLARRLAGQAVAASEEGIDSDLVAEQLSRWDARHEEVGARVRESGSRPAIEALQRAEHHRERAGALHAAGDLEQALRQLRAAFDLLHESSELAR